MINVRYPNNRVLKYIEANELYNDAPYRATRNGRIWEKKIYKIYEKLLDKNYVALDIGSYIGTHTLPMAMFAKEVIAFEPNPYIFSILKANVMANEFNNIVFTPYALSDENGMAEFDCRFSGTSRFKSLVKKHRGEVEQVVTKRLDDLYPNISNCNFIKLDVEGAEFSVLDGAKEFIERNRPCIIMEVFKTIEKKNKLDEWCVNNGYSCASLACDDYYLVPLEDLSEVPQ